MSEWPSNPLPEKNPEEKKNLPEINEIFIENIANELENFFLTADDKDVKRLSQAVFYEFMLKKNFQIPRDTETIAETFQKILTYFGASGDSNLKKIILKKKGVDYNGPADHIPPPQGKDADPTPHETKPVFSKEQIARMIRDSDLLDARERRRADGSHGGILPGTHPESSKDENGSLSIKNH